MLKKKTVEFFAHQSGISDLEIAERDVVLTYALQLLDEKGHLKNLAFKGGTCIRKIHQGVTGRFSMDLDFTARELMDPEEVVLELMETFNGTYHGITFSLDKNWRVTKNGLSLTVQPTYTHNWTQEGGFDVQVSFRERPTLDLADSPQIEQAYFKEMPFQPKSVPCLPLLEVLSEKIRAAYQRAKVRDLHDLFVFSTKPLNRALLRRMVVIKLWQANDLFHPPALFDKFKNGQYDWNDLKRLLRKTDKIDPNTIINQCISCYAFLSELTDEEQTLSADAKSHKKQDLWQHQVDLCRADDPNKTGPVPGAQLRNIPT